MTCLHYSAQLKWPALIEHDTYRVVKRQTESSQLKQSGMFYKVGSMKVHPNEAKAPEKPWKYFGFICPDFKISPSEVSAELQMSYFVQPITWALTGHMTNYNSLHFFQVKAWHGKYTIELQE